MLGSKGYIYDERFVNSAEWTVEEMVCFTSTTSFLLGISEILNYTIPLVNTGGTQFSIVYNTAGQIVFLLCLERRSTARKAQA
jgi:hypothetical protein